MRVIGDRHAGRLDRHVGEGQVQGAELQVAADDQGDTAGGAEAARVGVGEGECVVAVGEHRRIERAEGAVGDWGGAGGDGCGRDLVTSSPSSLGSSPGQSGVIVRLQETSEFSGSLTVPDDRNRGGEVACPRRGDDRRRRPRSTAGVED